MQTHIVQIGNSLGLRLPKPVLDSLSLGRNSVLGIETVEGNIVLSPFKTPRSGWADAFSADPAMNDEALWGELPLSDAWSE